jgi:hypothetical protein
MASKSVYVVSTRTRIGRSKQRKPPMTLGGRSVAFTSAVWQETLPMRCAVQWSWPSSCAPSLCLGR